MLVWLFFFCCCLGAQGAYVDDENSLRTALFSGYNPSIRPNQTTNITLLCELLSLQNLDIELQLMTLSIIVVPMWSDYRLQWTPSSYGNITTLVEPTESVWIPKIVVENDVSSSGALPETTTNRIPLRIDSSGQIMWPLIMETTTVCEVVITYYPFDTQECSVAITSWSYDQELANLAAVTIGTAFATENGEWELLSYRTTSGFFQREHVLFPRAFITFTFRRRWQFYGQNLLMPIVLTSILMCAVFALPIDTGEKMGYCLTVLLSFIVFLTWITDSLPAVSTDVSIIQIYLAIVLNMGVAATLMTVWILYIYHRPEGTPMSPAMKSFVRKVLVPFSRLVSTRKSTVGPDGSKDRSTEKKANEQNVQSNGKSREGILPNTPMRMESRESTIRKLDQNEVSSIKKITLFEEEPDPEVTWQEAAAMMDTLMLWLLMPLKVLLSIIVVIILYAQY